MAKIIDLENDLLFDDCETCKEPTKRVFFRAFDIDGPGRISTVYTCDNKPCKAKQYSIASYIIRREV